MNTCKNCNGLGATAAFVMRSSGCSGLESAPCAHCWGTGVEVPGVDERRAKGAAARADREARGLSLGDEATRLGISVVELSRMERGLPP